MTGDPKGRAALLVLGVFGLTGALAGLAVVVLWQLVT